MSCDGGGGGGGGDGKGGGDGGGDGKGDGGGGGGGDGSGGDGDGGDGSGSTDSSHPRPAARQASAIGSKVEVQAHRSVTVPSIAPTTSAISPPSRTVASISIEPMRARSTPKSSSVSFMKSGVVAFSHSAAVLNCGGTASFDPTSSRHESDLSACSEALQPAGHATTPASGRQLVKTSETPRATSMPQAAVAHTESTMVAVWLPTSSPSVATTSQSEVCASAIAS